MLRVFIDQTDVRFDSAIRSVDSSGVYIAAIGKRATDIKFSGLRFGIPPESEYLPRLGGTDYRVKLVAELVAENINVP